MGFFFGIFVFIIVFLNIMGHILVLRKAEASGLQIFLAIICPFYLYYLLAKIGDKKWVAFVIFILLFLFILGMGIAIFNMVKFDMNSGYLLAVDPISNNPKEVSLFVPFTSSDLASYETSRLVILFSMLIAYISNIGFTVFTRVLYFSLGHSFGKGPGFKAGLIVAPTIFCTILGFDNSYCRS